MRLLVLATLLACADPTPTDPGNQPSDEPIVPTVVPTPAPPPPSVWTVEILARATFVPEVGPACDKESLSVLTLSEGSLCDTCDAWVCGPLTGYDACDDEVLDTTQCVGLNLRDNGDWEIIGCTPQACYSAFVCRSDGEGSYTDPYSYIIDDPPGQLDGIVILTPLQEGLPPGM